jgi:hypothetical protein
LVKLADYENKDLHLIVELKFDNKWHGVDVSNKESQFFEGRLDENSIVMGILMMIIGVGAVYMFSHNLYRFMKKSLQS